MKNILILQLLVNVVFRSHWFFSFLNLKNYENSQANLKKLFEFAKKNTPFFALYF